MYRLLAFGLLLTLACGGGPATTSSPAAPDGDVPPAQAAALAAGPVVPARPAFPLVAGDRWAWELTHSVGAGLRVLFMPTEPAQSTKAETWSLTIDSVGADGRAQATWTRTAPEGLPARTALVLWQKEGALWMEGPDGPRPALEMEVPPDPVATEKVTCVAHFLGGLPGMCSPAPGGPLQIPPGPVYGIVSQEADGGRTLAQVLVGIGTAGLLIPGNKTATVYATLTGWEPQTPATPSDRVQRWRADPAAEHLDAVLEGPVEREEAAAIVALMAPRDLAAGVPKVMARVSLADRVALLRVALGMQTDGRLDLLASLLPAVAGTPSTAQVHSVEALLPEPDRAAGAALLEGRWVLLRAVLEAPASERLPTLDRALAAQKLASGEGPAILRVFDEPGPALDLLLTHTAPAEGVDLLTAACAGQTFDDDRLALLKGRDTTLAAAAGDLAAVERLAGTFTFDAGRGDALKLVIAAAPSALRPPLLRLAVQKMTFDDARLALLDAYPAEARAMSRGDRAATLESFVFQREEAAQRLSR